MPIRLFSLDYLIPISFASHTVLFASSSRSRECLAFFSSVHKWNVVHVRCLRYIGNNPGAKLLCSTDVFGNWCPGLYFIGLESHIVNSYILYTENPLVLTRYSDVKREFWPPNPFEPLTLQ